MTLKIRFYRLFRKVTDFFRFDWWAWEFESCERCGSCYRFFYWLKDDQWRKIIGKKTGCFCLDCLVKKAEEKDISLKIEDFERIDILHWRE